MRLRGSLGIIFALIAPFIWTDDHKTSLPELWIDNGSHLSQIRTLEVDSQERYILTASIDKTARLWDLASGRLLRTFRANGVAGKGCLCSGTISPDGTRVAISSYTNNWDVHIFDSRTGELIRRLADIGSPIHHLLFSDDGRFLMAGLYDDGIRLYDAITYELLTEDDDYTGDIYGADFDSNNRLIVASFDGFLRLYQIESKRLRLILKRKSISDNPFSVQFSPDGTRIAVADISNRIEILSGTDLSRIHDLPAENFDQQGFYDVAWEKNGNGVIAGSTTRIVKWKNEDSASEFYRQNNETFFRIRPLKNGNLVYATDSGDMGVLGRSGELKYFISNSSARFPLGDNLLISENANTVEFQYGLNQPATRFSIHERILNGADSANDVVFPPNPQTDGVESVCNNTKTETYLYGVKLYIESWENGLMYQIDPEHNRFVLGTSQFVRLFDLNGTSLWSTKIPDTTFGVNLSRDGKLLVAALKDGTIRWYRILDGKELLALYVHSDKKSWVLYTPEGYYDAAGDGEKFLRWQISESADKTPVSFDFHTFADTYHRPDIIESSLLLASDAE